MFEGEILSLLKSIEKNQKEIIGRMAKLEDQVNGEYVTVREAAATKGCSIQAIHHHLMNNIELEPEVDWIKRGGKNLIKRTALSKIVVKKSA